MNTTSQYTSISTTEVTAQAFTGYNLFSRSNESNDVRECDTSAEQTRQCLQLHSFLLSLTPPATIKLRRTIYSSTFSLFLIDLFHTKFAMTTCSSFA